MAKNSISSQIPAITAELKLREAEQDRILSSTREIIRHCAVGIKLLHSGEIAGAKKEIASAQKKVAPFSKTEKFSYLLEQVWQEIAEARLFLAAVEKKEMPTYKELSMPFEPYLLGICDLVGELRREMLECLKAGDKREAARYFEMMSGIYDELSPLRFSNSLLPNFRKKQDVARSQVEQARSELVRATSK
jgi:translin